MNVTVQGYNPQFQRRLLSTDDFLDAIASVNAKAEAEGDDVAFDEARDLSEDKYAALQELRERVRIAFDHAAGSDAPAELEAPGAAMDSDVAWMATVPNTIVATQDRRRNRRLLQVTTFTGSHLTVQIQSGTQAIMDAVQAAINLGNLVGNYVILQSPQNQVITIDTAFSPVTTVMAGFIVDGINFNDALERWVVDARYNAPPNTVVGLYLSKFSGQPPYTTAELNKFYVSQHPCQSSVSICCMRDFKDSYVTGELGADITSVVGSCSNALQNQQTNGLFDPTKNPAYVDNLLLNYPNSSVHRVTADTIQLLLLEEDIRNEFSVEETLVEGGKRWTFFLGASFFTMLPAPAVSSTSSQTQITIQKSNSLTFSFASEQDYSFIKFITLSLFSNRWVDNLVTREMQVARIGVVLPQGVQQNTATGLFPLSSVRFAVAQSLPDQSNQAAWTNPCLSSDNTGLWDIANGWRTQYEEASAQSCATQFNLCSNPITALLTNNFVQFDIPLGDGTVGPTQFNAAQRYNLYVYFDLSIVNSNGIVSVTNLFAQAPISELSINRACESLQASTSLLEATEIDIAIGLVGNDDDWQTSVRSFPNVQQTTASEGLADTSETAKASSLASGLITLVIKGDPNIFTQAYAQSYTLHMEQLTTLHFLDHVKFDTVKSMMATGEAYSVFPDAATGRQKIVINQVRTVSPQCNNVL